MNGPRILPFIRFADKVSTLRNTGALRAYDCRLHRLGRLEYEFPRYVEGCCVFTDGQGHTVILAHDLQFHHSGQVLGTAGYVNAQNSFWATVEQTDEYIIEMIEANDYEFLEDGRQY